MLIHRRTWPSTAASTALPRNRPYLPLHHPVANPDPTKPLENRAADPESGQSPALVGSGSAPFAAYTSGVDSALRDFDWPHHGADSLCQPGARPCSPALQPNPLEAPAAEVAFAIGRKFRR